MITPSGNAADLFLRVVNFCVDLRNSFVRGKADCLLICAFGTSHNRTIRIQDRIHRSTGARTAEAFAPAELQARLQVHVIHSGVYVGNKTHTLSAVAVIGPEKLFVLPALVLRLSEEIMIDLLYDLQVRNLQSLTDIHHIADEVLIVLCDDHVHHNLSASLMDLLNQCGYLL